MKMQMNPGWRIDDDPYREGISVVLDAGSGRTLHGVITLHRENISYASTTRIFDNLPFRLPWASDQHGISEKGKASLLSCYGGEAPHWDETAIPIKQRIWHGCWSCGLASQYAVFGENYLGRDDAIVRSMQFKFDGFRAILDNDEGIGLILDDTDPRVLKALKEQSDWPAHGLLDADWVYYVVGKRELMPATQTPLGSLRLLQAPGVGADHSPYIEIDFPDDPVTLDQAVDKMNTVREFLAWMVGFVPRWKNVLVFTGRRPSPSERRVHENGSFDRGLLVFTSHRGGVAPPRRDQKGMLISQSRHPEHFRKVMKKWLERHNKRERQHTQFFGYLHGMFRSPHSEVLCAAANVFDYLLADDKRGKGPQHVAKNRYRSKIRRHVKLRHMEEVIRSGIYCRHYIEHGELDPRAKAKAKSFGADYSDPTTVYFLSQALRFVYAAAELVDCGWNMSRWLSAPFGEDHWLGRFLRDYKDLLARTHPSLHDAAETK